MLFIIEYDEERNNILKKSRGASFEEVSSIFEKRKIIEVIVNPNYKNQYIAIIKFNNYPYAVPFVWDKKRNVIFLKTVYPNRNYKHYLKKYEKKQKK